MQRCLSILFTFVWLVANAAAQDCESCEYPLPKEGTVQWSIHKFCNEDCRQEWYLELFRCKICNDKVEPRGMTVRDDGMFVYIQQPKPWDGFCDDCREGVKSGAIDPVEDRFQALDSGPAPAVHAAPAGETAAPRAKKNEPDDSGAFVSGILKWVVGIGVLFVFLLRKLFS